MVCTLLKTGFQHTEVIECNATHMARTILASSWSLASTLHILVGKGSQEIREPESILKPADRCVPVENHA